MVMPNDSTFRSLKQTLDKMSERQTRDGLARVFNALNCQGVAKEIKAGRRVRENVEYGVRVCVHPKIGPRINVNTGQFYRQTSRAKEIEKKMVDRFNKVLTIGGYQPLSPNLLAGIRRKDKAFEKTVKQRFGTQFRVAGGD